jgi:hypothetical protein
VPVKGILFSSKFSFLVDGSCALFFSSSSWAGETYGLRLPGDSRELINLGQKGHGGRLDVVPVQSPSMKKSIKHFREVTLGRNKYLDTVRCELLDGIPGEPDFGTICFVGNIYHMYTDHKSFLEISNKTEGAGNKKKVDM